MTSKGIKTSAQGAIIAAGKSAAEGAKALRAASTAAAGVVLDKVATAIEANVPKASLPSIPSLQKIKAAQTRLAELNRQLDECARDDPWQKYK